MRDAHSNYTELIKALMQIKILIEVKHTSS